MAKKTDETTVAATNPAPAPEMHPNARELAAQVERDEVGRLAADAFAAYNVQAGGLTWDKKPIPPWPETGEKVQANWRAAIARVLGEIDLSRFVQFYDASERPLNALVLSVEGNLATLAVFHPDGSCDVAVDVPGGPAGQPGHWHPVVWKFGPAVAAPADPQTLHININGAVLDGDAESLTETIRRTIDSASATGTVPLTRESIDEEERRVSQATPDSLAHIERLLKGDDPAPSAQYTDQDVKVARAMYLLETAGHPDAKPWEKLKVPEKRNVLAGARDFLTSGGAAAQLVNTILAPQS